MTRALTILPFFIVTLAFGQAEPELLGEYKRTERMGNFLTRWYFDITGTSLIWTERLRLYSDSTYHYMYFGGDCGTFDEITKGTWSTDSTTIVLTPSDDQPPTSYIPNKGRLYHPNAELFDKKSWVMR
ncbi:MAG: hypothetical protein ACMVP2_20390 [Imperialibacter sp.]|uniref:hypothetical protein n=1 Tax=Imperialibacter sp. TaxID=2038411 RepID=UPI003A85DC15